MRKLTFSINDEHNNLTAKQDEKEINLPALWLRERCQDKLNLDSITK